VEKIYNNCNINRSYKALMLGIHQCSNQKLTFSHSALDQQSVTVETKLLISSCPPIRFDLVSKSSAKPSVCIAYNDIKPTANLELLNPRGLSRFLKMVIPEEEQQAKKKHCKAIPKGWRHSNDNNVTVNLLSKQGRHQYNRGPPPKPSTQDTPYPEGEIIAHVVAKSAISLCCILHDTPHTFGCKI
jgi:hypothetical protein